MTDLLERTDLAGLSSEELAERYCTNKWRPENWTNGTHGMSFKVGKAKADVHSPHNAFSGVWSVYTKEKHRGQGHGRHLMQVITAWADAAGRGLFLTVHTDNPIAIHLYESVGFRITWTRDRMHGMKRYPTRIPSTPEWDRHFEQKAIQLERDNEPRLGSDEGVAFFDCLYEVQRNRPDVDRERRTGSKNYDENTRRLSCDDTLAALREAGWTITRTEETCAP